LRAIFVGLAVAIFLLNTGRGLKAIIEVCEECLIVLNSEVLKKEEQIFNLVNVAIYRMMFTVYWFVPDDTNTKNYSLKLLEIYRESAEIAEEGNLTLTLANICEQHVRFAEVRELYKKGMGIMRENGDKNGEAHVYVGFGTMSYYLGEYDKAIEYLERALAITIEIGDRKGEASCCGNLGAVCKSLSKYDRAKEYLKEALAMTLETGDRNGEASCRGDLGVVFQHLDEHDKATEYHKRAIAIKTEIGEREGEACCYGNLGTIFTSESEE